MPSTLFLYLKSFSFTGGIEKFNRCFLKALNEIAVEQQVDVKAISSHDTITNEQYFPASKLKAFGGNRIVFTIYSIWQGLFAKTIILGHINLALLGIIIKTICPKVNLILIVHGIDVWQHQQGLKLKVLEKADTILSVSSFTKNTILKNHPHIAEQKIKLFPNTIDPFFSLPTQFIKPTYLQERYGLTSATKLILTVTRLANTEQYKGYDHVIAVLPQLSKKIESPIQYMVGGKAQAEELKRIQQTIQQHQVNDQVQLIGFIKDEELTDHYLLADVFVLPSKKEGFGIVFIEAMACGLPVIAGNKDGSVDALMNGELGTLIDPDNEFELLNAIIASLNNETHNPLALQQKVVANFGFHQYKQRLKTYLEINN
mgnify:FL=1|jgi:phosphatidylinositol alpha-1,6-mannosyltransferase